MDQKKKIMVTEDDAGIADALYRILSNAGYEVELQPDGVKLLSMHDHSADLILLDNKLVGIEGVEICEYLKSQVSTRDIPIILISASPDLEMKSHIAGADDFIEKPFTIKHLLSKILQYLPATTTNDLRFV